jgi:hypothetical protein
VARLASMHKKITNILALAITFVSTMVIAQPNAVNRTYTKPIRLYDLTFAEVILKINGKNWDDNINVTITVMFKRRQIFCREIKDTFVEEKYFVKSNYSDYPNCNSYLDCKKYFYAHLIKDVVTSSDKYRYITFIDPFRSSAIKSQFQEAKIKISRDNIDSLVYRFQNHLIHGKYDELNIPSGSFLVSGIFVYDAEISEFIDIDLE